MPVIVRDNTFRAAIALASLVLWPAITPPTFAQGPGNGAAPAEKNGPPAAIKGNLPDDPREAYQVTQRRMTQALRRMNESKLTPKVILDYKKYYRQYRGFVRGGINSRRPAELETLRAGLRYRLYQFTDRAVQDNPASIENALKTMRREMGGAGSSLSTQQQRQFRELMFGEMLPLLKELLQNNLVARSCAIELLADMEVVPASLPGSRMIMHEEVDDILIDLLNDDKQPNTVKLRALNSITNFLQKHDAIPQIQIAFAEAITKQLKLPYISVGYQVTLLGALEEVTAPRQLVAPNTPFAFLTAAKLMQDPKQHILVRCHAAAIFGRSGFDSRTKYSVLAWAFAELTSETAVQYKAGNKDDWEWNRCAYHLYRAFHHWDAEEAGGNSPGFPKGALNRDGRDPVVNDAWKVVLPVVAPMYVHDDIPAKALLNLLEWSKDNKPDDLTFDPGCPPLTVR